MAILTSTNLVASHTLYSLIVAYLLLTAPETLLRQNLISTLGASFRLPPASPLSLLAKARLPPSSPSPAIRSTLSVLSAEGQQIDTFAEPNPATAIGAIFLAFYALNDIVGASLPEPCFGAYWAAQSAARLVVLFALEAWIYLSRPPPASFDTSPGASANPNPNPNRDSWTKHLKTDLVFTWVFVELVWTFWIFYILRGEKRQIPTRRAEAQSEMER